MVQPLSQWRNSSLSQALALCEEVLTKALAVSELEALALSERRLRKFLIAEAWDIAKKANKWLVSKMPDEGEDLTGNQIDKLVKKYVSFWKDFPEDTSDEIEKVTNEGYLAGKKVMIERAFGVGDAVYEPILKNQPELGHLTGNPEFLASYFIESVRKAVKPPISKKKAKQILAKIKPKFDLKDVRAAKELTRTQVFWVGEYFNKSLSKQISKVVKQIVIDEGLRAREAREILEETLTHYWDPKKPPKPITDFHIPSPPNMLPSEYWEAVAANAATVGRIQGSMRQLGSMNVETYTVVNPVDERTCPTCSEMNGMVLNVNTSIESMDGLLGKSPEEIKRLHPWPPEKEQLAKIPEYRKEGDFKFIKDPKAQTKFQKEGRGYPSFHFRCRCSIDIHSETITRPIVMEPEVAEKLPGVRPIVPIKIPRTLIPEVRGSTSPVKYDQDVFGKAMGDVTKTGGLKTQAQVEVRRQLNSLLYEEAGLVPFDAQMQWPQVTKLHFRERLSSLGVHWKPSGRIVIRKDQHKLAQEFLDALKKNKIPTKAQANGFHTFIHEGVHGTSNMGSTVYEYSGVFIEEMTTEAVARWVMMKRWGHDWFDFTSYNKYLNKGLSKIGLAWKQAAKKVVGKSQFLSNESLIRMLIDASVGMRNKIDRKQIGSIKDYAKFFVKQINPKGDELEKISKILDPDKLDEFMDAFRKNLEDLFVVGKRSI